MTVVALDLREIFLLLLMMLALTPVAGESWPCPCLCQFPRRQKPPCWWSWLFFGLAEEVYWVEEDCFPLDVSAEGELVDLIFLPESFSSFLTGLFPQWHLESMLQILEEDCSNAFASTLTAFSTASLQESWFRPRVSNWAQTEGFRSFLKYQIMVSSFGVAVGSNSWRIACRCFRWAIQSRTSSSWCWESLLIFLQ